MRRSTFIIGMLILLAAGLPVGCSHDVDVTLRDEIAVTTRVTGMQQKRVRSVNNNDSLQLKDIKIDAYFHDTETKYLDGVKLHYTGGDPNWQFWNGSQVHYYWPIEGSVYDPTGTPITVSSLDFVGYCPFERPSYITADPTYAHATGTSFACNISSYMTNTAQKDMQEYVIAVLKSQTYATQVAASGALPLTFKHPFALIKFVIAEGSGEHVQVDSIGIGELYTGATCAYNGGESAMTWSGHTGSATLSIEPANPLKYNTAYTVSDTMMVIPATYAGTKTLTVKSTWDEWSAVTKTLSTDIAINWEPGYIYIYNLTVTKYALKVDIQRYTEQW